MENGNLYKIGEFIYQATLELQEDKSEEDKKLIDQLKKSSLYILSENAE